MFYIALEDDRYDLCETSPQAASEWYVDPASAGTIPD